MLQRSSILPNLGLMRVDPDLPNHTKNVLNDAVTVVIPINQRLRQLEETAGSLGGYSQLCSVS